MARCPLEHFYRGKHSYPVVHIPPVVPLSATQKRTYELMKLGKSRREIAEIEGISYSKAKARASTIINKGYILVEDYQDHRLGEVKS